MDFTMITACGECCIGCKKKEDGFCKGCIESDGNCQEWAESGGCPIYKCAKEHNVRFCGLCNEFPCKWVLKKTVWRPDYAEEHRQLANEFYSQNIRQANESDVFRIAEMLVFNYRLNFYPIFKNDEYYFEEMQVKNVAEEINNPDFLNKTFVYDDGTVKGFIKLSGNEIEKLFVEPVLQGQGTGRKLLDFAFHNCGADYLWALEKNERAISFYQRNGFMLTDDKKPEEDTEEYLVMMKKA